MKLRDLQAHSRKRMNAGITLNKKKWGIRVITTVQKCLNQEPKWNFDKKTGDCWISDSNDFKEISNENSKFSCKVSRLLGVD